MDTATDELSHYILLDGKPHGPYTRTQIADMLARGEILPTTLTMTNATEGWLPCEDVLRGQTEVPDMPSPSPNPREEEEGKVSPLRQRLPMWVQKIMEWFEIGLFDGSEFFAFNIRFYGRLSRLPYLLSIGLTILVTRTAIFSIEKLENLLPSPLMHAGVVLLLGILLILLYTWQASLVVRRLHDIGGSGWWALALIVPNLASILFCAIPSFILLQIIVKLWSYFLSEIFSLALLFVPGDRGRNIWGDNPKW